jgi:ParB family transcriptional regulator, chromosome partitioning protein
LSDLPEWSRTAHAIRRALTESEVPATDKRVRFLGIA